MPISSHELLFSRKTNMKNEGSGNVTGLKFELVLVLNLVLVVQSKAPYYLTSDSPGHNQNWI